MRYVCVHGHFYQPPRENPSLEAIELQDSAYPYHDWNERVCAECYAPNAFSRILDDQQRIISLVNNYSQISFNFGPTLLSWIEAKAPQGLRSDTTCRQVSQERFAGHGSAMAQAYNHMILPLANRADKTTQVKWGIADFEHRFHRQAGGNVAAGDCRRHRNTRSSCGKRHTLHDSGASTGEACAAQGQPKLERRQATAASTRAAPIR